MIARMPLPDRFSAKTWIFWAMLWIFGLIGSMNLVAGALIWTGNMRDANGRLRQDDGPYPVIGGAAMLSFAALAGFNLLARRKPLIRCYREGVEFNIIGASSLDGTPLVPGLLRAVWLIISLQGFRKYQARLEWDHLKFAGVQGTSMNYVLAVFGKIVNQETKAGMNQIVYAQVAFQAPLQEIAATLNAFARDEAIRENLESWA